MVSGPTPPTNPDGKTCVDRRARAKPACNLALVVAGGTLGVLDPPVHGKASHIRVLGGRLFEGLPAEFRAGRYHSLFAIKRTLPHDLDVTAESEDGVVMAIEHRRLPLWAVQFHPESIMTLGGDVGLRLLANVMAGLAGRGVG